MEIEEFKNLILNYIGIQCGTDSEIYQETVARIQKLNVQKLSTEDFEHYYRQKNQMVALRMDFMIQKKER